MEEKKCTVFDFIYIFEKYNYRNRVDVWENEKLKWDLTRARRVSVSTLFRVLTNWFHEYFYWALADDVDDVIMNDNQTMNDTPFNLFYIDLTPKLGIHARAQ